MPRKKSRETQKSIDLRYLAWCMLYVRVFQIYKLVHVHFQINMNQVQAVVN